MAVRVVKAYEATSDFVFVTLDRNVDFPTDGKPTSAIRASPLLLTSKPEPPPPPAPGPGSNNCALRRASFLEACQYANTSRASDSDLIVGYSPFEKTQMIFCISSMLAGRTVLIALQLADNGIWHTSRLVLCESR